MASALRLGNETKVDSKDEKMDQLVNEERQQRVPELRNKRHSPQNPLPNKQASVNSSTHWDDSNDPTAPLLKQSGNGRYTTNRKASVFDFSTKTYTCPTCQGVGRVPKKNEEELVAIIPYKDKRLKKPTRYCCYFSIFLLLFIITGSLALALLYPRAIELDPISFHSNNWTYISGNATNTTNSSKALDVVNMNVTSTLMLNNLNFVPVTIDTLNISVYHDQIFVGCTVRVHCSLPARQQKSINVTTTLKFTGGQAAKIKWLCKAGQQWRQEILLKFNIVSQYNYMGQDFSTNTDAGPYLDCGALSRKKTVTFIT